MNSDTFKIILELTELRYLIKLALLKTSNEHKIKILNEQDKIWSDKIKIFKYSS